MPSAGCAILFLHFAPYSPCNRLQGIQRNRTLAVKHQDGEPLTRVDLQYDLLYCLFTDPNKVFTDPYPTLHGDPAGSKVTFRDLYVNTLLHSPRCSKVSREKLQDNPEFADEFAKIALLSNVGRINTTMACKYSPAQHVPQHSIGHALATHSSSRHRHKYLFLHRMPV